MSDNSPAVLAFSFIRSGPVLVWSETRPHSDSWRSNTGPFVEAFAVVVLVAILTRYVAVPALQWLAVRVP